MTEYIEYLQSATITERPIDDPEDTQPMATVEIAYRVFDTNCQAYLYGQRMKAGLFTSSEEFKAAKDNLIRLVGRSLADEIMSDWLVDHKHLFT